MKIESGPGGLPSVAIPIVCVLAWMAAQGLLGTARVLQERGLTTKEDWEYGFYVRDPDNAVVQMLPAVAHNKSGVVGLSYQPSAL